jgi:5-methylthioadenosine/S-adenosylhomocysteine deaminase
MVAKKTKIRASFVIAFDGSKHRYLKDGELVYQGRDILYVGRKYVGEADETIDASGKVVSPGFISTHAHLATSPLDKSFIEDKGNPLFYCSGLYDSLAVRHLSMERGMFKVCLAYSLAEVLKSGITTVVEIGRYGEDLIPLIPMIGNRVYFAQRYQSGQSKTTDSKQVLYEWDNDLGKRAMEQALTFTKEYDGACGGLLKTMLAPARVDTCTEELLVKSQEWAHKLNVPLTIHASQAVIEFNEMLRRHGKTPLQWLRDIGFLQENVILGHAIIIGGTSWTNYPAGDMEMMAECGCSVAHAPWVFCRRGIAMESFYQYQKAGINMTLGTDTCPQNMIREMRWAAVLSKIHERFTESTAAADVFMAATLGGAKALGRNDLGRLCSGAKADIVIFSSDSMNMVPLRDPVKNIVYNADAEDVDRVIINGRTVLEHGKVLGVDVGELNCKLQEEGTRLWSRMKLHDHAHRSVDELSPLTFEPWEG